MHDKENVSHQSSESNEEEEEEQDKEEGKEKDDGKVDGHKNIQAKGKSRKNKMHKRYSSNLVARIL